MKHKKMSLALLLAAVLLCAGAGTMTAEAAVPGTNIGGYWDLSFGDKNGWLILSEHPRGGFWGGELYIYRAKKHHDKSIADWHCPVSASFVQNGASTLIQDLQGNGGGSTIAYLKIYDANTMTGTLYVPQYPTMYSDGRDSWYWNGNVKFSARKR